MLSFDIGASSAGMAGAQVSRASGAESQFWNPSLLAGITTPQIGVMHAAWLQDLNYEWLGGAAPLGQRWGVGSLSVAYFHLPSIQGADAFDNPTGSFRAYDLALTAGIARKFGRSVALGANVKLIHETIATVGATGPGFDLGASGMVAGNAVGASIQNVGPALSFDGARYALPQTVRFGTSRELFSSRLVLAADYNIPKQYYHNVRVGAEFQPYRAVALRIGYRHEIGASGDPLTGISFGLGTRVKGWSFDYAMTPGSEFSNVHRFSFGYAFGPAGETHEPLPPEEKPEPPPAPKGPTVIARARPSAPAPATSAPRPAAKTPSAPSPADQAAATQATASPAPAPPAPVGPVAPSSNASLYEVVLTNYQSEESAKSELKALEILGFSVRDATITYTSSKGYQISLARVKSKSAANTLASALERMSYRPTVLVVSR